MDVTVLGWAPDADESGPTLRLDWRRFSYAGKFVMSNTGKAVVRAVERSETAERTSGSEQSERHASHEETSPADAEFDESVLAAVAFNEDRCDERTLWLRYVTVRGDRRGEGLGPRLCDEVVVRAFDRGYERVRIAVNNPFAYEALYKVGFGFTGRETGIAELVLERPSARDPERYRAGLDRFRDRDLSPEEAAFLDGRQNPP